MINPKISTQWWEPEYGFFGEHYLTGDNSLEGYLAKQSQTLSERTFAEVRGIIKLLNLKSHTRILDIPCGYGRHSIELAKLGYAVVGSELNPIHLDKAKQEAKTANVDIQFCKENMSEINYHNEFDALINMFYSFGFFETDEENMNVLKNFYRALKKGGKFLFHTDVNVPRILNGEYKNSEIRTLASGGQLQILDNYDYKTKRINGSWIITNKDGKIMRKDYSVRVYEQDEFVATCHEAGFRTCKSFSDWDGSPYNLTSEDMIIIAIK